MQDARFSAFSLHPAFSTHSALLPQLAHNETDRLAIVVDGLDVIRRLASVRSAVHFLVELGPIHLPTSIGRRIANLPGDGSELIGKLGVWGTLGNRIGPAPRRKRAQLKSGPPPVCHTAAPAPTPPAATKPIRPNQGCPMTSSPSPSSPRAVRTIQTAVGIGRRRICGRGWSAALFNGSGAVTANEYERDVVRPAAKIRQIDQHPGGVGQGKALKDRPQLRIFHLARKPVAAQKKRVANHQRKRPLDVDLHGRTRAQRASDDVLGDVFGHLFAGKLPSRPHLPDEAVVEGELLRTDRLAGDRRGCRPPGPPRPLAAAKPIRCRSFPCRENRDRRGRGRGFGRWHLRPRRAGRRAGRDPRVSDTPAARYRPPACWPIRRRHGRPSHRPPCTDSRAAETPRRCRRPPRPSSLDCWNAATRHPWPLRVLCSFPKLPR